MNSQFTNSRLYEGPPMLATGMDDPLVDVCIGLGKEWGLRPPPVGRLLQLPVMGLKTNVVDSRVGSSPFHMWMGSCGPDPRLYAESSAGRR